MAVSPSARSPSIPCSGATGAFHVGSHPVFGRRASRVPSEHELSGASEPCQVPGAGLLEPEAPGQATATTSRRTIFQARYPGAALASDLPTRTAGLAQQTRAACHEPWLVALRARSSAYRRGCAPPGLAGCLLAGVDRALIAARQLAQRVYQLRCVHDLEVRVQHPQVEGEQFWVV